MYGEENELSMHYKLIDKTHPVIIGREFWHRVTGFPNFYNGLVSNLHLLINKLETENVLNEGVKKLADEIEASQLFDFKEA